VKGEHKARLIETEINVVRWIYVHTVVKDRKKTFRAPTVVGVRNSHLRDSDDERCLDIWSITILLIGSGGRSN